MPFIKQHRLLVAGALLAAVVAAPASLLAVDPPQPCPKERFAEERLELEVVSVTVDGVEQPLPPEPDEGFVLLYEELNLLYGRVYDPDAVSRDRLLELGR